MGVVYGAGSLWQWMLHPDEPGQSEYFAAPGAGWREAVDFEGSSYVGLVPKILAGLPTTDMEPDWTRAITGRALSVPGRLFVVYRELGGPILRSVTGSWIRATARWSRPGNGILRVILCRIQVVNRASTSARLTYSG